MCVECIDVYVNIDVYLKNNILKRYVVIVIYICKIEYE